MSRLYDWVFHYNHFTGLWSAIPRSVYNRYWDNDDVEGVMKSTNIHTLIEIINRDVVIEDDNTFKRKSEWTSVKK